MSAAYHRAPYIYQHINISFDRYRSDCCFGMLQQQASIGSAIMRCISHSLRLNIDYGPEHIFFQIFFFIENNISTNDAAAQSSLILSYLDQLHFSLSLPTFHLFLFHPVAYSIAFPRAHRHTHDGNCMAMPPVLDD